MKQYGALRGISGVLKFVGWATIILGALFFVITLVATPKYSYSPYGGAGAVVLVAIVITIAIWIVGILFLASGELIEAVVDIAINTAHLPSIAQSSERTVGFFDHMSAKANATKEPNASGQATARPVSM
jgi:preprotein translocase subunit SecG